MDLNQVQREFGVGVWKSLANLATSGPCDLVPGDWLREDEENAL